MKSKILLFASALLLFACSAPEDGTYSRRTDFTADWRFSLSDDASFSSPDYNDENWRTLNLPHDWAIEGDFSEDNPSGTGGGALPGGIGWYRKTFKVKHSDEGKLFRIDFDGVYMNSTVYINGHKLGTRPYGYISFSYDLTPYIKWGEENVIAVRVDNAEQPNSRWYSGCGIYRNVWLTKLDPVHVAQWGTYVTTEVTDSLANVTLRTTVENEQKTDAQLTLLTEIVCENGVVKTSTSTDITAKPGEPTETVQTLKVKNPELWSVDRPYLYNIRTSIIKEGETVDTYDTPLGIRTFNFDPKEGFFLNGQRMKINGVCLHHDLGCLGAAVNTRAIERQLELLKEMGCNGIRCSHNPPAPELLDLCDRMGFIVMDEAFDMWRKKKTRHDYARYFNEWHERDLTDLVVRDRNHPSVFIWSIGNEVLEQWTDAGADTLSIEEANLVLNFGHSADQLAKEGEMSVNSLLTKKLADRVRELDPTRPVTAGCNEPNPDNHLFRSGALDLIGFNYHDDWFAGVPKNFPDRPFIVTESVSGLATRGYYRMPSDSMYVWPVRWDIPFYDESYACSSYDNCHVPWGNTHEGTMRLVKLNDFISGQYVWTGFDYLGEPTPYGWPARSSYFGLIDLAGFPKDIYYMYQAEWRRDLNVLHLFPHWNWKEGDMVDMWAYLNNADTAELYVNGVSQGIRINSIDSPHVSWRVKFEPGTVRIVSRKVGRQVAEMEIHTAGAPAKIRLTPDRTYLKADGKDLSFITVEIVDEDGTLCPWADNDVTFSVEGAGFIAGVDNGSPISMERFKDNHRRAFYGKCLLVVQNNGERGSVKVTATSPGLEDGTTELR